MKKYCYFDGKICLLKDAKVSANDLGILRGYGVFDFFRTRNGKLFHFSDHYKRFANSARTIGLSVPIKQDELEKIVYKLLEKNSDKDSSFRLVLTGGPTSNGMSIEKPIFYILAESLYTLPEEIFKKGGKLITFDYSRLYPESKNTNYLLAVTLQKEKIKKKALEILYLNGNKVLECSTSNIFLIKGNNVITPKEGILKGITRKIVLGLAKKEGMNVIEKEIDKKTLLSADEVFITATNKDISPIVEIDGKKIKTGKPGEKTKILMDRFSEYTKNY